MDRDEHAALLTETSATIERLRLLRREVRELRGDLDEVTRRANLLSSWASTITAGLDSQRPASVAATDQGAASKDPWAGQGSPATSLSSCSVSADRPTPAE